MRRLIVPPDVYKRQVDWSACRQLLENLAYVLDGRELDYLLVNHLEPDHAACIEEILLRHPKARYGPLFLRLPGRRAGGSFRLAGRRVFF